MAQEPQTTRCPQCGKSFPTSVKLCPDDGAVLEHQPQAATQIGKVLDGKYRLDAFLSQGGMGGVYRATHVMLNKKVAVKLINPELVTSPEVVRRFQREARAATALSHPNIVSVYDLGQTAEGTLYIAMEFVDGPSLKSVIESGGPIPAMRTLTLTRQLASALSLAHRHGVIHRDLKPHNVMLARSPDGQEIAKLVDFGIAKTFDEGTQLTSTGFVPGTPQYMSPEQAEGQTVDARSDLYSFGIILYEMLTGEVPFNATSAASVLIKHIKEAPVPPSVKNPRAAIPPELEAIVLRCMAKDPAERFQNADELGGALEQAATSLAGSVAAMQATLPMGRPSAAGDAVTLPMGRPSPAAAGTRDLATVPAAAASPASSAPTLRGQQPMAGRASSDTRSTAMAPLSGAGLVQPPPASVSGKSSATPVLALVVLLIAVGAAAILYFTYFRGRATSPASSQSAATSPASEPPAASPAMASQNGQPQPSSQLPAAAPTPASPPPAASQLSGLPAPAASAGRAPAASANASPASANRGAATAQTAVPAGGSSVPPPAAARNDEPARQAAPAAIPENPAVFFQCAGASEVCSPLRTAVDEALEKAGLSSVRNAARADIGVTAQVDILQERVDRQFQTTFAVRNYSIEVSGETTRTSETVTMPPSTTLSFDPRFGSERAVEKARLVAGDIVDRIKAFVRRKRGA